MTKKKLRKLERRLSGFRRGAPNRNEVEALAIALGRQRRTGQEAKGKEPSYVSRIFHDLRPITIPHHSEGLNRYTGKSILDDLEALDIARHHDELDRRGSGGHGTKKPDTEETRGKRRSTKEPKRRGGS